MEEKGLILNDMEEILTNSGSNQKVFTTITDKKTLFNLESSVDYKINDCIGEKIRVKNILMKTFEKEVDKKDENGNLIVNQETGEIEKTKEYKIITILIDDGGKSFVTASKTFAMALKNYIGYFGLDKIHSGEGIEIEIIQKTVKTGNKALTFKILDEE